MSSCRPLDWTLLWSEWLVQLTKPWSAPWLVHLSSASHYAQFLTQETMGCFKRKVVTSPCCGTVQCLCHCLRNVNLCANESLLLFSFLHIMSERVIYFLFVKAWFHQLHGREIGCTLNFLLVTGSSFAWKDSLSFHHESYADSMKGFLFLGFQRWHFIAFVW